MNRLTLLLALACGQEPPTAGWRGFLRTKAAQSMTPEERAALAASYPIEGLPRGYPQAFYSRLLVIQRTMTRPAEVSS